MLIVTSMAVICLQTQTFANMSMILPYVIHMSWHANNFLVRIVVVAKLKMGCQYHKRVISLAMVKSVNDLSKSTITLSKETCQYHRRFLSYDFTNNRGRGIGSFVLKFVRILHSLAAEAPVIYSHRKPSITHTSRGFERSFGTRSYYLRRTSKVIFSSPCLSDF